MKLDGYAIITGGVRGIGEAMTLQLAKEGYNVVVNYVSDSSGVKAEKLIERVESEYGVKGLAVQADVSNYSDVKRMIEKSVEAFGEKIAILVNNAGIAYGKSFLEITEEEYSRLIGVNLTSALHVTHVALPYMVNLGYGRIVNISSIGGIMGVEHQIDYSAAKAGIIGMTKAMAREFGKYHITVNSIAPGMIWTDMLRGSSQEEVAALKSITPLGMIGDVEDISDCLSYVVNAKFLTGQTISPNGGLTI